MFKNFIIIVLGVMCVTMVKPVKKASANNSKFITIETSQGNVVIETLPKIAPNHVKRIKELVKTGFYDGIIFHRSLCRCPERHRNCLAEKAKHLCFPLCPVKCRPVSSLYTYTAS